MFLFGLALGPEALLYKNVLLKEEDPHIISDAIPLTHQVCTCVCGCECESERGSRREKDIRHKKYHVVKEFKS